MSRIRKNQNRFPSPHSDFSCTQALYLLPRNERDDRRTSRLPGRAGSFANRDRVGASTSSAAWPWQAAVAASGRLEAHNQIESDLVFLFHRESFIIDFPSRSRYRSWLGHGTDPFLPKPCKLIPCILLAMLSPDGLAAGVPRILWDVVVLPNKFGLIFTAESKMPEDIVDQVENALSKHMTFGSATILLEPEKVIVIIGENLKEWCC